jgi:hypothetical protein
MSRQQDERQRILEEMRDRFGSEDPMVSQWGDDVQSLEHIDLHYPTHFPPWRSVKMEPGVQCPEFA